MNILKVSQFRNSKEDFIKNVHKMGVDSIALYCACAALPIAAALVFVKEEFPELEGEMNRRLGVIKEFYGYDEIDET